MYLVLIETSGNQNFIFSTNKLKENIGASELTYRAGTKWVLDAVARENRASHLSLWTEQGSEQLRQRLLDAALNKPIESSNDVQVEVIIATSGKALLLTKDDKAAKAIIRQVTQKALREAPGLDICGAIQKFNWDERESLAEAIRKIYKKFESVRSRRPIPALRFLRLPVIDQCSTSGLPASRLEKIPQSKPISAVSYAKRKFNSDGFKRIESLLWREKLDINFARSVRVLDEEFNADVSEPTPYGEEQSRRIEWLAVIHADGNGLGEIFLNFDRHIKQLARIDSNPNRDYVNRLRQFSIALDICTEKAFLSALDAFTSFGKKLIPIVPLVLGGDDLTVVCDGKSALYFTQKFLKAFERETNSLNNCGGIIRDIAEKSLGIGRLSACAGVAMVKPHFPFSVAYDLAEALTKSAKKVKEIVKNNSQPNNTPYPCSALDFHIVYDTSGVDLDRIREKLAVDNESTKLYSRPYVVTDTGDLNGATGLEWVALHRWECLEKRVRALTAKENGRPKLPNSQMHDLRSGLFFGKEFANARYQLVRDRYIDKGILELEGKEKSLFLQEPISNDDITGLLDALDAAKFLELP